MYKKLTLLPLLIALAISTTRAQLTNYATGIPVNYVKVIEPTAPYTNVLDVLNTSRTVEEVKKTTQYFDGLGRPIQTVSWQTTPLKKDMVAAQVYDAYGREAQQYLPYVATTNDGLLKYNVATEQQSFNTTIYGTQGETFFYGKTNFEPSPLNRPIKAMAAGNSWVGANRGVEQEYLINNSTDAVRIWNIGAAATDVPTTNTTYPAGELYKNVSKDEHGKQVVEFKDKEGKVLLKKVQIDNTVVDGHTGWYCTYYVYDDFNQLRYVIPPKAVNYLINKGWSFTNPSPPGEGQGVRLELCFYYLYDAQGRMIVKKVPGAGEVWMVYDERDRLVMTQDANLRASGKWMITVYDALNRPVQSGLWSSTADRATHQANATAQVGAIAYPTNAQLATGWELLTQTGYDDYSTLPSASGLSSSLTTTNINGTNFITTYNTAPSYALPITASTATKGLPTWAMVKVLDGAATPNYLYTVTVYDEYSRPIQTKSKNVSGGQDVATMQYDFSGKVLRTHQSHQKLGGAANVYNTLTKPAYDHVGRVLNIKKTISTTGTPTITGVEKTIATNAYNELGQLKTKKLAAEYSTNGLENLNYEYNIRGWLLGINRGFISTTNPTSATGAFFGFELGYDKTMQSVTALTPNTGGSSNAAFNGNIGGTVWRSKGDGEKRRFDYTYDNANRLLSADFNQHYSGGWSKIPPSGGGGALDFSIKMGDGTNYNTAYDENGNIKQMQQWGWKLGGSVQIDNLTYNYTANSNKLLNVIDANNDPNTKLGDFRTSLLHPNQTKTTTTLDYTYDDNGNLKKDLNKDMGNASTDGIAYNYLNLPQTITVYKTATTAKGSIAYTYDATGGKLSKKTTELGATVKLKNGTNVTSDITTTTDYTSRYVYETKTYTNVSAQTDYGQPAQLQFTGHEEGRIRMVIPPSGGGGAFVYDYMLKDHLGNVRMTLTEEQKQDVYPATTLENTSYSGGTAVSVESQFYTIDASKIVANPAGITAYQNHNGNPPFNNNPYSNTSANSTKVYKTNATINKIGLGITLKVMAGDNINIFGKSFHKKPTGGSYVNTQVTNNAVLDVLNALVTTGTISTKGFSGTQLQPSFPSTTGTMFAGQPTQNTANTPKASINWIVFDEQFKYVTGSFDMVGTAANTAGASSYKNHQILNVTIPKNGYIYVYCNNESNYDVFFDNIQVIHNKSAILEETHYYPFGLTMAGISSKAAGGIENRSKWNAGTVLSNKEFSDGGGLEMYETAFRLLDSQLGRFWQIDPLGEMDHSISSFAYVRNNPLRYTDPLGLDTVPVKKTNGNIPFPNSPKQDDVVKVDNGDGSTSFYNYDPLNPDADKNGFVGTGQQAKPEEPVTVSGKNKSNSNTMQTVGTIVNWIDLSADIYENSLVIPKSQRYQRIMKGGQFQAWYNGELMTWKLGFNGNQYVNSSVVAMQKVDFIAKVGKNAKTLEFFRRGGVVFNWAGIGFTLYDINENGLNSKNGTDLFFGAVAFVPGVGWVISGAYFLGDQMPGGWKAIGNAVETGLSDRQRWIEEGLIPVK